MSKIIGRTTATPVPRSDWNQIDETKVDFIKNKPTNIAYISEEDNENITDVETSGSGGANITIDSALSTTSINPVQNKVITQEINRLADKVNALPDVTSADSGKILRVSSDGKIEAIRIMNAEGVSF